MLFPTLEAWGLELLLAVLPGCSLSPVSDVASQNIALDAPAGPQVLVATYFHLVAAGHAAMCV